MWYTLRSMALLYLFNGLVLTVNAHGEHEDDFKLDPHSEEAKAHLKEDLNNVIDKSVDEMDASELQFHYFKQHDYDSNQKLDGNELMMSITHHEIENPEDQRRVFTDLQLQQVVDGILKHHDKNDDGYMDFNEYISPIRENKKE